MIHPQSNFLDTVVWIDTLSLDCCLLVVVEVIVYNDCNGGVLLF